MNRMPFQAACGTLKQIRDSLTLTV